MSGACDFSMDSIESVESVISTPSITNYHREGPPIFNPNRGAKWLYDFEKVQL